MQKNKKNDYYVTFFGANATGKSSTAGWLTDYLLSVGDTVETVGTYKIRKGRKYHTGGADALKSSTTPGKSASNEDRTNEILRVWNSDARVAIGEGMFLSAKSDILRYAEIKKTQKERKLIIFHLYADIDVLGERITERGNKPLTEQRIKRLKNRTTIAVNCLKPFRNDPDFKIIDFDTSNPENYEQLKKMILKELEVE